MEHTFLRPLVKRLSRVPAHRWEYVAKPFYTLYVTSLESLRISVACHDEGYLLTVRERGILLFSEQSTLVEPGRVGTLYTRIADEKVRYDQQGLKRLRNLVK